VTSSPFRISLIAIVALCLWQWEPQIAQSDDDSTALQLKASQEIQDAIQLPALSPQSKLITADYLGCADEVEPALFVRYNDGTISMLSFAGVWSFSADEDAELGYDRLVMLTAADNLLCDSRTIEVEKDYTDQPREGGAFAWFWKDGNLVQERLVGWLVAMPEPRWEKHPYNAKLDALFKADFDAFQAMGRLPDLQDPNKHRLVFSHLYDKYDMQTWPCLLAIQSQKSAKRKPVMDFEVVNRSPNGVRSVWVRARVKDHFGNYIGEYQTSTGTLGGLHSKKVAINVPQKTAEKMYDVDLDWSVDER